MDDVIFEVKGSAAAPYLVTFSRSSKKSLSIRCTCPSGRFGQLCKHRVAILSGDKKGIVSSNLEQVELIQSWIKGTEIEKKLIDVKLMEKVALKSKESLVKAKKVLLKEMMR